jgi:hypothetical protein
VIDPVVEALILDLLQWLTSGERTYEEVMGCLAHVMPQTSGLGGCK